MMEDPFFVVREEVQKALTNVNDLYGRWKQLVDEPDSVGKEEYTWILNEINNNVRSIEWDLEDLTETINIVESNPTKFQLSPKDIEERRYFIKSIKSSIMAIKSDLKSSEASSKLENNARATLVSSKYNKNKYERLDNDIIQSNQRYINEQHMQQKLLVSQQDSQLEHVGHSVGVLKSMGHQIGDELDDQALILDELGHEIEETNSKLQTVLLRVEKMLRLADDKKQTYVLIGLIIMLIIVVVLFVAL